MLEALRKFTGTVVFVSHDRYFIDNLATRIFEIEGGEFRDYPGNYEDYLWQKEHRARPSTPPRTASKPPPRSPPPGRAQRKTSQSEVSSQKEERREVLEKEIARCEADITAGELELTTFKSAEESKRVAALLETAARTAAITKVGRGASPEDRAAPRGGAQQPGKAQRPRRNGRAA